MVGACEAREEIGEVRRGGIVAQGQIAETRSDRPTEELPELHDPDDSKNLLESEPVVDRPGTKLSWTLVAASVLFAVLLLYVMFVGYLPAKRRMAGLELELKELYQHEAELQTKIQAQAVRERQLATLSAERDALAKRVEALERELAAARRRR